MDYFQQQAYTGLFVGTIMMISLHNLTISIFLFKVRETKFSNLLKIIFNFSNLLRFGSIYGTYMTPDIVALSECIALEYLATIGNVGVRVTLTAFLLWRLKQIHNENKEKWICIILLVIRTILALPQLIFQRPKVVSLPDQNLVICDPNVDTFRVYSFAGMIVEFFIDIYVTARLVQILNKANKNVAQLSSNIDKKNKRTIFTAVIYWNFLRLFVVSIYHISVFIDLFSINSDADLAFVGIKTSINVLLSYVITADAEIVRVIEGKSNQENNKNIKKESTKIKTETTQTTTTTTTISRDSSSQILPEYTPEYVSPKQQQNDEIVVSMKRLSFHEWANVIVGNENVNDDEIIVEPFK